MNPNELERLRREFPAGARVELIKMDDKFAPPIGTAGTVVGVDDSGSIMVKWDNGSSLHVLYDADICKRIDINQPCEIIITESYGNWRNGKIGAVAFRAKVYEEKSEYAIDDGNVGELWLDGVVRFRDGWEHPLTTQSERITVNSLLEFFADKKNWLYKGGK